MSADDKELCNGIANRFVGADREYFRSAQSFARMRDGLTMLESHERGALATERWIEAGRPAYEPGKFVGLDKEPGEGSVPVSGPAKTKARRGKSKARGSTAAAASGGVVSPPDVATATDPQEARAWQRLKDAAKAKRAGKLQVQEWAADHIEDDPRYIRLEDVPSPGAVDFLRWARNNPDKFYKEMYGKVGASKQSTQQNGRLTDDGRSITDILTEFERGRAEFAREQDLERIPAMA